LAKFKVGDRVLAKGWPFGATVLEERLINIGYNDWPISAYRLKCGGLDEWWVESALTPIAPTKYRVVLETENPEAYKNLNGSKFISSDPI